MDREPCENHPMTEPTLTARLLGALESTQDTLHTLLLEDGALSPQAAARVRIAIASNESILDGASEGKSE